MTFCWEYILVIRHPSSVIHKQQQQRTIMTNNAQILTFSRQRGRGRPKNNRPTTDTGTPETVMKRLLGVTTEALDLCLEHGIINQKQHWCGIHLRWLYTLRHGVPSVRALDLSQRIDNKEKSIDYEDPIWREAREKEYNEAINTLTKSGHAILLLNLCIYNERPQFLNISSTNIINNAKNNCKNIGILCNGLDVLAKLWERK